MKIVRFLNSGTEYLGTDPVDGTAEIVNGTLFAELTPTGRRVPIDTMLAPLIPPNLYGVGMNYREHARQMKADIPTEPPLFMKPTTTIVASSGVKRSRATRSTSSRVTDSIPAVQVSR